MSQSSKMTVHGAPVAVFNDATVYLTGDKRMDADQVTLLDGGWLKVKRDGRTSVYPREKVRSITEADR